MLHFCMSRILRPDYIYWLINDTFCSTILKKTPVKFGVVVLHVKINVMQTIVGNERWWRKWWLVCIKVTQLPMMVAVYKSHTITNNVSGSVSYILGRWDAVGVDWIMVVTGQWDGLEIKALQQMMVLDRILALVSCVYLLFHHLVLTICLQVVLL